MRSIQEVPKIKDPKRNDPLFVANFQYLSFCFWDFDHLRHPLSRPYSPFCVIFYCDAPSQCSAEGGGRARAAMIVIDKVAKVGQGDGEEGDSRAAGEMMGTMGGRERTTSKPPLSATPSHLKWDICLPLKISTGGVCSPSCSRATFGHKLCQRH